MGHVHFDQNVDIFDDWEEIAAAARRVKREERDWSDLMSVSFNDALNYAFNLGLMEAICFTFAKIFIKEGKLKVQLETMVDNHITIATRDIPMYFFSMEAHKYFDFIGEDAECTDDEKTITVKFTKRKE